MGEILVLCIVAILINWSIKKIIKKIISNSKTAEFSVRVRRVYRYIRLALILSYTLVMVVELYFVIPNIFVSVHHITAIRLTFSTIIIILLPYVAMSLPISIMTIKDLRDEDFALYLRGFSSDSYEASMYDRIESMSDRFRLKKSKEKDVMELPFSEHDFAKAVKCFMPIYGVGMTKEIESPEGCKRIYLNDEDWQVGVKLLIEKAKMIFILINPSDSCIWEILQSQQLALEKTVFFVDNIDYLSILKDKMEYNTIPDCIRLTGKHTYNYIIGGECHSYSYTNNKMGFLNALNVYLDDQKNFEEKKKEKLQQEQKEQDEQQYDYSRYMPKTKL